MCQLFGQPPPGPVEGETHGSEASKLAVSA